MQLKKTVSIHQALALASCSLLAGVQPARAQGWETEAGILFYNEQDRVQAVEPVVRVKKRFSEDEHITVQVVADVLTGASPNGAVPATAPQTFTSPSGEKTYTTPANETPLDPTFRDERMALSVEWGRPLGRELRGVFQGHFSGEHDYKSMGLSATLARDFNTRNTTFTGGLSYNKDEVDPVGGMPIGLSDTLLRARTGSMGEKDVLEALLGVTQVLNRNSLLQLNYTYGNDSGYLTDPYKLVSVVDAGGNPASIVHEKRPEDRTRHALYARTLTAFGRDVLHASYRYYRDDWGVSAHTVDLRYRLQFSGGHYLEPQFRYSLQNSAADFYRPYLPQGETVEYVSADYRLATMTTTTLGMKYGIPTRRDGEFALRIGYMLQTGEDHPAGAPGQLASQDLFPDTRAILIQLNYSHLF